jgi:FliI/YscN family ATPase
MASIAKQTSADVSVIALIGERGREVQEFLHEALGEEGLKRCVVIVATGDDPPLLKVRAAKVACTVAESLRDEGADVLLLMDSLTRLAQAQRQIGLAAGEPPATRGFPPSVFALLPQILERAGKTEQGSITGFYTVLVEGNDFDEPIPDAVKGIADGHILLSRDLAAKGHYPAIDVLHSISRVRNDVVDGIHRQRAERVLRVEAAYRDIEDLISVGAYVPGQNAEQDLAVAVQDDIKAFLQQRGDERPDLAASTSALEGLFLKIEQKAAELRQRPAQAQPAA